MSGVGGGVGDGALRDEREAHDVVYEASITIRLRPSVLEEGCGEGDDQRRYHAARHDGSHDDLASSPAGGDERRCAEDVGSLVERTTHVDGHHAADDGSQKHDIARTHAVQEVGKAGVDGAKERI